MDLYLLKLLSFLRVYMYKRLHTRNEGWIERENKWHVRTRLCIVKKTANILTFLTEKEYQNGYSLLLHCMLWACILRPISLEFFLLKAWSFLANSKSVLPVILKLFIRKCFVQNRFYKLPVGQASSFDSLKKSALRIKIKDKKIEKLYMCDLSPLEKRTLEKCDPVPPRVKNAEILLSE